MKFHEIRFLGVRLLQRHYRHCPTAKDSGKPWGVTGVTSVMVHGPGSRMTMSCIARFAAKTIWILYWLVVGEHFLSHIYWVAVIIPIDELIFFRRGGPTTNQFIKYTYYYILLLYLRSEEIFQEDNVYSALKIMVFLGGRISGRKIQREFSSALFEAWWTYSSRIRVAWKLTALGLDIHDLRVPKNKHSLSGWTRKSI